MISSGSYIDSEHKAIIEKLMALGITPTGNKASDKAKLREIELKQVKVELGNNGKGSVNSGKYLTVSTAEIERMRMKLQENDEELQEKRHAVENKLGATQEAEIARYWIKVSKLVRE